LHLSKYDLNGGHSHIYNNSNKKSGREKTVLLILLIMDVLILSGIIVYAFNITTYDINRIKSNHDHIENHTGLNSTEIPDASTKMSTTNLTTTYSDQEHETLMPNEESKIRDTLILYYDTLNAHSPEDAVNFFTNEVEITINYGEGYSYQGPKEGIVSYLEMGFNFAPDSRISEVKISNIKIHQNKATVQIGYIVSSESFNFSIAIDEYMDFLKENNEWKIRRINIEY
jgi:hypothetical protein